MAKRTKKAAGSAALDPALLRRVIVEGVSPLVDEGRYPAKATTGEEIVVEADVFADGHDILAAVVLWPQRRHPLLPRALGHRRARARAVRRLVRNVPAIGDDRPGAQRYLPGRRTPAALRRVDGLRRALPAADSPDRQELPQGTQQHADAG